MRPFLTTAIASLGCRFYRLGVGDAHVRWEASNLGPCLSPLMAHRRARKALETIVAQPASQSKILCRFNRVGFLTVRGAPPPPSAASPSSSSHPKRGIFFNEGALLRPAHLRAGVGMADDNLFADLNDDGQCSSSRSAMVCAQLSASPHRHPSLLCHAPASAF